MVYVTRTLGRGKCPNTGFARPLKFTWITHNINNLNYNPLFLCYNDFQS